jgi:hypothetical protein
MGYIVFNGLNGWKIMERNSDINQGQRNIYFKYKADVQAYQPHPSAYEPEEVEPLIQLLDAPNQLQPPQKRCSSRSGQEHTS